MIKILYTGHKVPYSGKMIKNYMFVKKLTLYNDKYMLNQWIKVQYFQLIPHNGTIILFF